MKRLPTQPRRQPPQTLNTDPETAQRVLQMIENAGHAIYLADVDGFCTAANAPALRLLDCKPDDLSQRRLPDFAHPAWRRRVRLFYGRQLQQRVRETVYSFPIITLAGEEKWVEQMALLLTENDLPVGFQVIVHDVTRHKLHQRELAEQRLRLASLVDNRDDAVWTIGSDYRLIALNDGLKTRFADVYQVSLEPGMNALDYMPPESSARWRAHYDRAFKGETFTIETEYTAGDRTLYHEVLFMPIFADGAVTSVAVISRNVTERRQSERALQENEERLRRLIENAMDVIFTLDAAMQITSLNAAFETITGWQRDEWIGQPFAGLIFPEDLPLAMTLFQRALKLETIPPFELRIQAAGGGFVTGEFRIALQIEDDRLHTILGIARDISERKRSEAERDQYIQQLEILQSVDTELSQVLQVDYVLKIALDAAVRLSKADAGAIHLLEDDKLWVAQVIGNFPRAMVGSRLPRNQGIIGRVAQSGVAERVLDVSKDRDYMAHVSATRAQITIPLLSRDRLIGVLNVQTSRPERFTQRIFDFLKLLSARIATAIDNARLYQQSLDQLTELQGLYQQVSQLEQLKTEMIRVASHDLRNPLGVASGYLQMLDWELEGQLSSRHQDYLKMIRSAVERIDKITKDILTLERIEQMARGLPLDEVNLREIVELAFADFRQQAAEKELTYQLEADDQPLMVQGDSIFLRETVANLLSNAIKYTPNGGQVYVRLGAVDDCARCEVQDSGFGIPEELQANLFQPFYRAVTKETKTIRGTGLGLHLVKQIVERHRGQMRFHSAYGSGSTFGFDLPLIASGGGASRRPRADQPGQAAG